MRKLIRVASVLFLIASFAAVAVQWAVDPPDPERYRPPSPQMELAMQAFILAFVGAPLVFIATGEPSYGMGGGRHHHDPGADVDD